jgi:hypothetical protein
MEHPSWDRHLFDGVLDELDRFWRSRGVANVDLRRDFGAHPVAELVVGRLDSHPNELAHRLAAGRIRRDLFPRP